MEEKMTPYEKAKKYYPHLWSAKRLENLYKANKLTEEEYKSLLNKDSAK